MSDCTPRGPNMSVSDTMEKQAHRFTEDAICKCVLTRDNIRWLLDIAQFEPDNVLRAMARARLADSVIEVLKRFA